MKNLTLSHEVFKFPGFKSFVSSGFLSSLGNWNYVIAMTALIYHQFGTAGVAVFGVTRQLPYIFLSPVAGYLIDKYPKKSLFIVINSLNIVSMFVLTMVTILDIRSLVLYFCVALIQVFVGTVDYPIRLAIGKDLVDTEARLAMNTVTTVVGTLSLMISPFIAGLLLQLDDLTWSFALNTCLYAVCVLLIGFIPKAINTMAEPEEPLHKNKKLSDSLMDIVEGFRILKEMPSILAISLLLCFIHIIVGSVFIFVPYLADSYALGSAGTGYFLAFNGLGCVIGTLLGGYVGKKSLKLIVWVSVLGSALACILCGVVENVWLSYVLLVTIGVFTMIAEAPIMTAIQNATPPHAAG
ncbi:MAG: MFS transporter, partial [Bacilli bacterium]